jgi:hypothetical protein
MRFWSLITLSLNLYSFKDFIKTFNYRYIIMQGSKTLFLVIFFLFYITRFCDSQQAQLRKCRPLQPSRVKFVSCFVVSVPGLEIDWLYWVWVGKYYSKANNNIHKYLFCAIEFLIHYKYINICMCLTCNFPQYYWTIISAFQIYYIHLYKNRVTIFSENMDYKLQSKDWKTARDFLHYSRSSPDACPKYVKSKKEKNVGSYLGNAPPVQKFWKSMERLFKGLRSRDNCQLQMWLLLSTWTEKWCSTRAFL